MATPATCLWCAGFEHGLAAGGTSPQKTFLQIQGAVAIDATSKRSGSYGLHLTPANAALTNATMELDGPTGATIVFGRFYVMFVTFPDVNSAIFCLRQGAGVRVACGFEFNNATSTLRPYIRDETPNTDAAGADGSALSTGVWYRIDFRITNLTLTTRRIEWYLDDTIQTTFNSGVISSSGDYRQIVFGETTDRGTTTIDGEYYFDDVVAWSDDATKTPVFPVGEGSVLGWTVDVDGTHSTAASFTDNLGNSPPASVYDRLDEIPHVDNVTNDHIYQDTIGAGDYLEVGLSTPSASYGTARAMVQRFQSSGSAAGVCSITLKLYDVVNAVNVLTVDNPVFTVTGAWWSQRNVVPASTDTVNFTKAIIDQYVLRIGYSADVTPFPRLHAVMYEAEFVPVTANEGWEALVLRLKKVAAPELPYQVHTRML